MTSPAINALVLFAPLLNRLIKPGLAAVLAACLAGRPEISWHLVKICERESRCTDVGIHVEDAYLSPGGWHGQVRLGHLEPTCQPNIPGAWATRGAWGLSAASHWEYLPRCYDPALFDLHVVSAYVAARKYLKRCYRRRWRPRPSTWLPWCHTRR